MGEEIGHGAAELREQLLDIVVDLEKTHWGPLRGTAADQPNLARYKQGRPAEEAVRSLAGAFMTMVHKAQVISMCCGSVRPSAYTRTGGTTGRDDPLERGLPYQDLRHPAENP